MKLARRKMLIAVAATVIAAAGVVSAFAGVPEGALAALIVLALLVVALQLQALRRIDLRQRSLDRLEQKLDVVARRVVTEAEATGRELGGRIDGLAEELRQSNRA
jgi:Flp pilus assembly protein TadB